MRFVGIFLVLVILAGCGSAMTPPPNLAAALAIPTATTLPVPTPLPACTRGLLSIDPNSPGDNAPPLAVNAVVIITGPGSNQECDQLTHANVLLPESGMANFLNSNGNMDFAYWSLACAFSWSSGLAIRALSASMLSAYEDPALRRFCSQVASVSGATPLPSVSATP